MNVNVIIFVVLLSLANSTAYAESKKLLTQGRVGEHLFTLLNSAEYCQLSISSAEMEKITLLLPSKAPCYFFAKEKVKGETVSILSYAYPKAGIDQVFLMGGSPVDPSSLAAKGRKLPINSVCTMDIQGITIEEGVVKLSKRNVDAFACDVHRLDEKMYHQIALEERESFDDVYDAQQAAFHSAVKPEVLEAPQEKKQEEPSLLDKVKAFFN